MLMQRIKPYDDKKIESKSATITLSLFMGLSVASLFGCSDQGVVVEEKMAQIRASKAQPVQPVPEPQLVEEYVYNASEIRSPFMPPSLLSQQQTLESNEGLKPDDTRKREPLESFELQELIYRGMIVSPQGKEYGLIERPDGRIMRVQVDNYMGKNHGRIVELTPTQVNLIEIVPDNRAGYREKSASVVSPI